MAAASILAPALVTLACMTAFGGDFDNAERMLERGEVALRFDSGPSIRTLFHLVKGLLQIGRGRRAHHSVARYEQRRNRRDQSMTLGRHGSRSSPG